MADDVRASDEEREKVVAELNAHAGAGRLSSDELEERVEAALAARTLGDLRKLLADLPSERSTFERRSSRPRHKRPEWRAWAMVSLLLIGIWALTGAGYFWPVWPIGGWAFAMMMPACGKHSHSHRRDARRPADGLIRV